MLSTGLLSKAMLPLQSMRLGVLFSGGKDSTLALAKAMSLEQVACLITITPENAESYFFHTPNTRIATLAADAVGLPVIEQSTKGVKEEELLDLKIAILKAVEEYRIQGLVTGAVESVYQARRIQKICCDLDLWCFNPLWKMNEEELLHETFNLDFDTVVTSVAASPLGPELLGNALDVNLLNKLLEHRKKHGTSLIGEGGEFETLVIDASFFKKKIVIVKSEASWDGRSGRLNITEARLVDK
jgi:diphthine-ammonia ligase